MVGEICYFVLYFCSQTWTGHGDKSQLETQHIEHCNNLLSCSQVGNYLKCKVNLWWLVIYFCPIRTFLLNLLRKFLFLWVVAKWYKKIKSFPSSLFSYSATLQKLIIILHSGSPGLKTSVELTRSQFIILVFHFV